ncbi:hypothetical protein BSZ39_03205 [Bowdeniella nasicola]|uniref:Uncharacterized protein n=1 Tax=Bowdeniella nasicola TaxID=208480 RepID=A0A1Q5Q4R5_9ACTO|nr:hypothetical protein [Bowdeniella nasicola]OKL54620.1 hypothetical protein BSZ39_03205 [Bowdeniella nasicola]
MSRSQDLTLNIGPAVPVVALIAFRPLAALAIGLLWGAPVWLLILTSVLSLAATGAWVPMLGLAFGALVDFLPARYVDGVLVSSLSWWASVAAIIVLAHALIISARLTERVGWRGQVEWRAIGSLARRSLPAQLFAQVLWGAASALPLLTDHAHRNLLIVGAVGLAGLAALIISRLRRTAS